MNQDDLGDYRPGQRAAKMHDVKVPRPSRMTKAEIRELAHRAGSLCGCPAAAV